MGAEILTPDSVREAVRLNEMKGLVAKGLSFGEMVPVLSELGLVECKNCEAGTPKTRITRSKLEVCTTCENTLSTFWRRNLPRLSAGEADLLQVRWQWEEAHQYIAKLCREHAVREITFTTTRVELDHEGKPVTVTTTRTERHLDKQALRLLAQVHDKLARWRGQDVDDPELDDDQIDRPKMNVSRRENPRRAEPAN